MPSAGRCPDADWTAIRLRTRGCSAHRVAADTAPIARLSSESTHGVLQPLDVVAPSTARTTTSRNGRRAPTAPRSALPRVAFVFEPRSFSAWALTDAARSLCELVWVVDRNVPETETMCALLRRTGDIVDVSDLDGERAAAAIGAAAPVGIVALKDGRLTWTADVASRLGLPFMSRLVAER